MAQNQPKRNAPCPCGLPQKFKKCRCIAPSRHRFTSQHLPSGLMQRVQGLMAETLSEQKKGT